MKHHSAICLSSALLLVSMLSACGDTASTELAVTNALTTAETAPQTESILQADLPDTDFGGRTFMVLGRDCEAYNQFDNFEIYAEKEIGEVVNDAVYRRNTLIEDAYNVKIEQTLYEMPHTELQKSASSGDHLYDLAFIELLYIGPCIQNGYFYDLNQVDNIDFTKPWWNPDVNETVSMGGKLYATTSDFSLRDKNRAYIILYNPGLAERNDIPDIIETVRAGEWTSDLMLSYIKMFAADLDGDGKMGGEFDSFGLAMDSYESFAAFSFGMGIQTTSKDNDGNLIITLNSERASNIVDRVMDLTCETSYALFCDDFYGKTVEDHWGTSGRAFYSERTLFMTGFPHSLQSASEKAEFDYGVIPFPKYDESQDKYYTFADKFCMLMGIPVTSTEPDFSGFMLEALSAASTMTSLPAYYDISCKTKYAYNESTGEMLDLIFDGIQYDLSMIYSLGKITNILRVDLPTKKENTFVSLCEKYQKSADIALDDLITAIKELDH